MGKLIYSMLTSPNDTRVQRRAALGAPLQRGVRRRERLGVHRILIFNESRALLDRPER